MISLESAPLLVGEYSGGPRGGKGSIVSHIAASREGVATEETGADYRAMSVVLLRSGRIEVSMSPDQILSVLGQIPVAELTDFVARRKEIELQYGLQSLHGADVETVVPHISPFLPVRKAVKEGFKERVRAVVADSNISTLLVDGRHLAPVIDQVENANLFMRTFVACTEIEAARREALRKGVELYGEEFYAIQRRIKARAHADSTREIDPVRPDSDPIDYWHNKAVGLATHHKIAKDYGDGTLSSIFSTGLMESPLWVRGNMVRIGAGLLSVESGRQILFDTTGFNQPKYGVDSYKTMLQAATIMFDEAIDATRNGTRLDLSRAS